MANQALQLSIGGHSITKLSLGLNVEKKNALRAATRGNPFLGQTKPLRRPHLALKQVVARELPHSLLPDRPWPPVVGASCPKAGSSRAMAGSIASFPSNPMSCETCGL